MNIAHVPMMALRAQARIAGSVGGGAEAGVKTPAMNCAGLSPWLADALPKLAVNCTQGVNKLRIPIIAAINESADR